ncbi:MAG: hypothetical protein IPG45_35805 [Deltaproteobacteria bacterium]|nr:hypothetical protein [Deltaproteobacteria bacterium]
MSRRALVGVLLLLVACRTTTTGGPVWRSPAEAAALAQHAEPQAAADLLWLEANDPQGAAEQLARGLSLNPADPELLLRRAVLALEHLDPEAAFADLSTIIGGPDGPSTEVALLLLEQHALPWPRAHQPLRAGLTAYLNRPEAKGPSRVAAATRLLAQLEHHARDPGREQGTLDRGGWLTTCRAVGPVAPLADVALAVPSRYERNDRNWEPADPFRGFVPPIRKLRHEAGGLLYAAGDRQGLYVIECHFEVVGAAPRPVILEVHLDGPGRVGVDGLPVIIRDLSQVRGPRIQRVQLQLTPGWHRLSAAILGGSEGRPAFSLLGADGQRVIREASADGVLPRDRPLSLPEPGPSADGEGSLVAYVERLVADEQSSSWGRFLGATLFGGRSYDDLERARALIEGPKEAGVRSAALLTAWARIRRGADLGEGEAGAALREAVSLDPQAAASLLELAETELRDSPERAFLALAQAQKVAPKSARVRGLQFRAFRSKGWSVEAARYLREAAELGAPPSLLLEGAEFLRNLERTAEADRLGQQAVREDPHEAHAHRAQVALRKGDLDGAIRAHEEGAVDPDGLYHILRIAELELARGRAKAALAAAQRALAIDPLATRAQRLGLTAALAARDQGAAAELYAAIQDQGEVDLALWSLASTQLGGGPAEWSLPPELAQRLAYDPWPEIRNLPGTTTPRGLDPADRWSGHKAVQLLDRVIDIVHGSQTASYRHSILRLQTKEATDQAGELNLPPEAWPLSLRTLKPDGRTKDVDRHLGKEDLSFSALAPGDAVERRFVSMEGAATPWGGYLRQYYFRGTSPIARSELVVVVPKGAQVWAQSYNGAPEPEIFEAPNGRVYYYRADQVAPLDPEPGAVDQDEYLPYVVIAVGVPTEVARLTNGLALERLLQRSPFVAEAAERLTTSAETHEKKARLLFDFVSRQISLGEAREPAVVLAARRGNKSGLLTAMLRAIGIPAELVLARAGAAPLVNPPYPDAGHFDTELIKIPVEEGRLLWAIVDDKHPWFGKLPPELRRGEYAVFDGRQLGRGYGIPNEEVEAWPLLSAVDLEVDESGTAVGTIAVRLPGAFGGEIREFLLTSRQEDVQRQMQSWVGALVPGAILVKFSTEGRDEPLVPLVLRAEVRIEQFMVQDQDRWVAEQFFGAPLALQSLGLPTLATYVRLPRRESPLLIHELAEHMEVRVRLPAGTTTPLEVPEAFVRNAAYGRFAQQFSFDETRREAFLVVDHQMPLLRLDPAAVPAFLSGAQEILQSSRNRLVVPNRTTEPRKSP